MWFICVANNLFSLFIKKSDINRYNLSREKEKSEIKKKKSQKRNNMICLKY